jgi:hypothetical protein
VDDEPARRPVVGAAVRVRHAGWHRDEAAGTDRARLALGPDLEGELRLENVEGLC